MMSMTHHGDAAASPTKCVSFMNEMQPRRIRSKTTMNPNAHDLSSSCRAVPNFMAASLKVSWVAQKTEELRHFFFCLSTTDHSDSSLFTLDFYTSAKRRRLQSKSRVKKEQT